MNLNAPNGDLLAANVTQRLPPVKSIPLKLINRRFEVWQKKMQKLLRDKYYSWSVAEPPQDGLTQAQTGQHRLISRWRTLKIIPGIEGSFVHREITTH